MLALGTITIWSLNVIVVKVALRDIPPLVYTAARFLLGAALLVGALRLRHRLPRFSSRDLGLLALAGALGIAANQMAFTLALQHTTAVNVSLILGSTPLLVAGWQALRIRERIGVRAWAGLVIGAGGVAMVVLGGAHGAQGALLGDLLTLAAAAMFALYLDRLVVLLPRYPALPLSAWVTVFGALELLPFGIAEGAVAHPHWTRTVLLLGVYSAVLAVTVANAAWYGAIERLGATRTAVYTYLQPFLGALFAVALLGESLHALQVLGGVVIIAGVVAGRPRAVPVSQQQQAPPPPDAVVGLAAAGQTGSAAPPR